MKNGVKTEDKSYENEVKGCSCILVGCGRPSLPSLLYNELQKLRSLKDMSATMVTKNKFC